MSLKEILGQDYTEELEKRCIKLLNDISDKIKESSRGLYICLSSKDHDASQLLEEKGLIKYHEGEYYLTPEGKKLFDRTKIPINYKKYKFVIGRINLKK
ncbi:MAG: hypothetical protein PHD81_04570 [Candidatus Nanoarchaeia archaeon]|nr:hypothetical protein [Candidatus Nanoarchaeia archaeon]MDD5588350.1 hypothetical protein [Candidatus Nanoarchaeia archaeon]